MYFPKLTQGLSKCITQLLLGFAMAGSLSSVCIAQQHIKLKDIDKIAFITKGHFMDPYYLKYEVKYENKRWKCYQTWFRTRENLENKDTIYKRDISAKYVKRIIDKVNHTDSLGFNCYFKVDKAVLIKYVDSINLKNYYKVTAGQRNDDIKQVTSKKFIDRAVKSAIYGMRAAGGYNFILLITKAKDTLTFYGNNNGVYHTPWQVNNKRVYDPEIGIIFNRVTGAGQANEVKKMYEDIYRYIHIILFARRVSKDDFKEVVN